MYVTLRWLLKGFIPAYWEDFIADPSIAQLVERWTVVGNPISIGRWFNPGSKDFFVLSLTLVKPIHTCYFFGLVLDLYKYMVGYRYIYIYNRHEHYK